MKILITNHALDRRAGTELYVRDLAAALVARGHRPIAFSTHLGVVADSLREATVPVVDDLANVAEIPDLIHGQHHLETMAALLRFPGVPAVFFCHGWIPWEETPPRHPRIFRYVAVDDTCRDRLVLEHGIPAGRVRVVLNFVDLERFRPRGPLPPVPRRAAVFSNNASADTFLPAVAEACRRAGVELDVIGAAAGAVADRPEAVLGQYDLVFAKARAALEALAVGCAVVLCDARGAGPMVTGGNVERLRRLNLGIRALGRPVGDAWLYEQIGRYDAADAAEVSRRVRAGAGLDGAVDEILAVYEEVLAEGRGGSRPPPEEEAAAASAYLQWLAPWFRGAARTNADHARLAADHTRLAAEHARLTADHAGRAAERAGLAEANARLVQDLARVRATRTWRYHEAALRTPIVGRLYRAIRRIPRSGGDQ